MATVINAQRFADGSASGSSSGSGLKDSVRSSVGIGKDGGGGGGGGGGGKNPARAALKRSIDTDPAYDNTNIQLGKGTDQHGKGTLPYTVKHTYRGSCSAEEYREATKELTPLQKHIAWFDGDADGVIWPSDTFRAFYALNYGVFLSFLAMNIVHGPFSYPTLPRSGRRVLDWVPDPRLPIYVANIHRAKHGSDSEAYDRHGQFQQHRVDKLFHEYSSDQDKDRLCWSDMTVAIFQRRNLLDFFGIFAYLFEFGASYMLLWPHDGYCSKDDMLGIYDGSVFPVLAQRRRQHGAFKQKGKVL